MPLTEDQQKRVDHIVNKYKTLEGQRSTLKTYVDGPTPNPINAKLRLETITSLYRDYIRYNEELTSIQADHAQVVAFQNTEIKYYDVATSVSQLQTVGINAHSTFNTSSQNITFTDRHEVPKLPTIKLPTFDGSHNKWLSFKNKVEALVDCRTDFSNTVKHARLLDALTGDALEKIDEYPPSETNYPKAWQALLDSYDQKRLQTIKHLDAIFNLPVIFKATPADLSMLIDKTRQHLHMLEQLGVKIPDEVIVRLLERHKEQMGGNSRYEQNAIFRSALYVYQEHNLQASFVTANPPSR